LIIHSIRKALSEQFEKLAVYVSDRRWQKAAQLLKASAFFNERKETNHSDALLLSHCIWTSEDNREAVIEIVHDSIKDVGFTSDISLAELDKEKDLLDKEIHSELFYTNDVYKVEVIGDKRYFKAALTFKCRYYSNHNVECTLYIPQSEMNKSNTFHPVDIKGNELVNFEVTFDGQGTCSVKGKDIGEYDEDEGESSFTPRILFHKGAEKEDINARLINSLNSSVIEVREKLMATLEACKAKNDTYKVKLTSPFVNEEQLKIPLLGVDKQLKDIDVRIKDCQRLEALCCE
jgi:MoxR-like ATPase